MSLSKHPVVSREQWLTARKEHLVHEKALTRQREQLSAERRALPWVRVDKDYRFNGPDGERAFADLFGGRSQLIVYHFMFGDGWEQGCPGCSFLADHFDGVNLHLPARDISLVVVSHAPWKQFQAFKQRMGWRFDWLSSAGSDFNQDYQVSSTEQQRVAGDSVYNYEPNRDPSDELPGLSVFYRNPEGEIFHTYSTYARGLDILVGTYHFVDLTPRGRDELGAMDWVRHHDRYEEAAPTHECCKHKGR